MATVSSEALAARGGTDLAHRCGRISPSSDRSASAGWGIRCPSSPTGCAEILGLNRRYRRGGGRARARSAARWCSIAASGSAASISWPSSTATPPRSARTSDGLVVRDVSELDKALIQESPDIGVIVVPGDQAQSVAERLVQGGVKAVLNFAPAPLHVPESVALKNVDVQRRSLKRSLSHLRLASRRSDVAA